MYIFAHPVDVQPPLAMPTTDHDELNGDHPSHVESNLKKRKRANEVDEITHRFGAASIDDL